MKRETDDKKRILYIVIFMMLTIWAGVMCFYHLGEAGIQNWDEARHIVNAYEMMNSDNFWIHTYRYGTDYYNFKPPLSIWCIVFFFRLFGINTCTMRLYSAVSMVLLIILLNLFVAKKFGWREAIISEIVFLSGTDLFFFHMARSADADALYLLLFTIAMLCLYQTEKEPWFLTGYGFFLSMAFLTKCLHVAIGVAILICYFPRIYKKLKFRHYLAACIGAAIPTGVWAIVRFSYDGLAFFSGMLGQEVVERVEKEKNYFGYLKYFMTNPVFCLAVSAALLALLLLIIDGRRKSRAKTADSIFQKVIRNDLYLFALWFMIPLIIYSASGAFMEWYSYICYVPFCVLVAVPVGRASKLAGGYGKIAMLLLLLPVTGFGISVKHSLWNLKTLNYENNTDIRQDIAGLIEKYPEYRGAKIYIENSRNEYQEQNVWEQNCIADAYIAGDLKPLDGGVPLFIEDEDAILLISKDLYEVYSNVLAGRIILKDGNDYLIFSNEFYS